MVNLDNMSNIEIENKSPEPVQNKNKRPVNQWKISCEHFRYKRCISILVCIISITIAITVPTVIMHKRKMKSDLTTTTTTEVPLYSIITNTTKWKQDGITVFQQFDFDESSFDLNSMYIDEDETIYLTEVQKDHVIELKLNATNFPVVAGGIEEGTHQLWSPVDVIVDKTTDSFIICDQGKKRIVRWPRQNAKSMEIIITDINCNGLAMDDKGYLYVTDWLKSEVRRWDIRLHNKSTIVAGGKEEGNRFEQLLQPMFMFVDKDYSVYVVDKSNHRVMKYMRNVKGGIVAAGGNGDGANLTQLSSPSGVLVDHLGNVYVTDTNNHRVMRWINGANEGSIVVGGNGAGNQTNQLDLPSDLLFDKHGNLYVFDSVNHRIQKFYIESN